jgi:hypothetical protein
MGPATVPSPFIIGPPSALLLVAVKRIYKRGPGDEQKLVEARFLHIGFETVPVVMMADRIAAALQSGWAALRRTAVAATCGHDMDVPETML